jgi:hypothetical protein
MRHNFSNFGRGISKRETLEVGGWKMRKKKKTRRFSPGYFLKVTGLSLLIVVIGYFLLIALKTADMAVAIWCRELDKLLDPSLAATLTGLSLAAATFLTGREKDFSERVNELHDEAQKWYGHCLQKKLDDERSDAEGWFKEQEDITQAKIKEKNLSSEVESYLGVKLRIIDEENLGSQIKEGRNYLIMSFYCFLFLLIESLTLDLLAPSYSLSSGLTGFIELFTNKGAMIANLDFKISAALLLGGAYFLWEGAKQIKT